jgi:hydrogenase-4 component E
VEESVFLRITGVLGTLFLLGAFAMLVARQTRGCIRLYAGQSFILAAVAALTGFITGSTHLYLMTALTIIGKVLFIPYLMDRVVHDSILRKREIEFVVNIPDSLLISAFLAALAFFTGKAIVFQGNTLTNLLLPVGAAVILIGLYVMVSRTEAVPQVTGLLVAENGVLMIAVPVAFGLPLVAEFGLFFDLLVGVLLMGILIMGVHRQTESTAVNKLCNLKE